MRLESSRLLVRFFNEASGIRTKKRKVPIA